MRFRLLAALGLTLLAATSAAAEATYRVQFGLQDYKPHQMVERILENTEQTLTSIHAANLTTYHERVADEPHRFKHDVTKQPRDVTHVPIISSRQAYDSTIALPTPGPRGIVATRFARRP
ncbi:MAG: hypothetical protein ABJD11_15590 [Gemmatimonadota bacterium]